MLDIKDLAKALKKYQDETIQEVKEILFDNGSDLLNRAQRSLNAYTGNQLENLNFINLTMYSKIDGKGFSVAVGVPTVDAGKKSRLAAYVEFGTGLSAQTILAPYPQEIKDLAKTYFVNGKGTLKGSPYLFNNYLLICDNFIKELNSLPYLEARNK